MKYDPKEDISSIVGGYTKYDKIMIKNFRMHIFLIWTFPTKGMGHGLGKDIPRHVISRPLPRLWSGKDIPGMS